MPPTTTTSRRRVPPRRATRPTSTRTKPNHGGSDWRSPVCIVRIKMLLKDPKGQIGNGEGRTLEEAAFDAEDSDVAQSGKQARILDTPPSNFSLDTPAPPSSARRPPLLLALPPHILTRIAYLLPARHDLNSLVQTSRTLFLVLGDLYDVGRWLDAHPFSRLSTPPHHAVPLADHLARTLNLTRELDWVLLLRDLARVPKGVAWAAVGLLARSKTMVDLGTVREGSGLARVFVPGCGRVLGHVDGAFGLPRFTFVGVRMRSGDEEPSPLGGMKYGAGATFPLLFPLKGNVKRPWEGDGIGTLAGVDALFRPLVGRMRYEIEVPSVAVFEDVTDTAAPAVVESVEEFVDLWECGRGTISVPGSRMARLYDRCVLRRDLDVARKFTRGVACFVEVECGWEREGKIVIQRIGEGRKIRYPVSVAGVRWVWVA